SHARIRQPLLSTLSPYTTLFRSLRFTIAVPDFLRDVYGLTNKAALVNSQNFYGDRYPYGVMAPAIAVEVLRVHQRGLVREPVDRSEEHTSELQSRGHLVCRLLLE